MGIGFEVVRSPIKPIWVPVNGTADIAVGMMVYYGHATPADTGGLIVMPAASGTCNVTSFHIPFGVVIGTNDDPPKYKALTTALNTVQYITGTDTAAAQLARTWKLAEGGMYGKGDPQPLAQVALITPETILKGYFRGSATVGTTVITETTAASGLSTTGATFTLTFGFTGVAQNSTLCYTSGANTGMYRVRTDVGTVITTNTRAFPYTPVAGDKAKSVNVKQGICRMNTDSTYGLWIDNTAALTSNYYLVNVLDINLMTDSGDEHCIFQFCLDNFMTTNSARLTT